MRSIPDKKKAWLDYSTKEQVQESYQHGAPRFLKRLHVARVSLEPHPVRSISRRYHF